MWCYVRGNASDRWIQILAYWSLSLFIFVTFLFVANAVIYVYIKSTLGEFLAVSLLTILAQDAVFKPKPENVRWRWFLFANNNLLTVVMISFVALCAMFFCWRWNLLCSHWTAFCLFLSNLFEVQSFMTAEFKMEWISNGFLHGYIIYKRLVFVTEIGHSLPENSCRIVSLLTKRGDL